MSTDVSAQLDYLRLLLLNLPKLDNSSRVYKPGVYELTAEDHEKGDGTDIGALHHRLEQIFGPEPIFDFQERGEGLAHVVPVLEGAYFHGKGDTRILGRWIQRLTKSAIAKFEAENVAPPEERRQRVPTKRSEPGGGPSDNETERASKKRATNLEVSKLNVKKVQSSAAQATSRTNTVKSTGTTARPVSTLQQKLKAAPPRGSPSSQASLAMQSAISNANATLAKSKQAAPRPRAGSGLPAASSTAAAVLVPRTQAQSHTTQEPTPTLPMRLAGGSSDIVPMADTAADSTTPVMEGEIATANPKTGDKPVPPKSRKATVIEIEDEDADPDYRLPKKSRRKAAAIDDDSSDEEVEDDDVIVIESDGETALRSVEAAEAAAAARGNRRGPKGDGLKFWGTPLKIVVNRVPKWEFKCLFCNSTRSVPRSAGCDNFDDEVKRPATGNLTTHTKKDHPNAEEMLKKIKGPLLDDSTTLPRGVSAATAAVMSDFVKKGLLNPKAAKSYKGFLRLFAAWIIDENLSFTTGESFSLKALFQYLNISYNLPSHTTVRNELARLFADLHGVVVRELTHVKSRIAYSTDTWTTPQMVFTFAGTIASFIDDDWNLIERAVDFAVLEDKQHEGIHAGHAFFESITARGGANKMGTSYLRENLQLIHLYMLAVTMDNASVCDVMARTVGRLILARYGVQMHEENSRIRCLPHVVNIVVQKMLSVLNEAEDPATTDYYTAEKDAPVHYNPELDEEQLKWESQADEDAAALEKDEAAAREIEAETIAEPTDGVRDTLLQLIAESSADEEIIKSPVKRLRIICTKIVSSPQRRAKFRRHVRAAYPLDKPLQALMVVRDVSTRWNFTHAMMDRALRFPKAIDAWAFEHRDELGSQMALTREDWELLRHMRDLLKIFPDVTRYMSQSGQPTLPWVLPMYSLMEEDLQAKTMDNKLPETIRSAATAGLEKLEHYHALARKNQYNWLATLLHPALRNWGKSQQDRTRARTILTHAFENYKDEFAESGPIPVPRVPTQKDSIVERILGTSISEVQSAEPLTNEIDRYLNGFGKALAQPDNALLWWKNYEKDLPILARMAKDFLAIPASSTSVERLFSDSGYLVTKQRASLSAATIRQCMCTKRWIREGLMKYL